MATEKNQGLREYLSCLSLTNIMLRATSEQKIYNSHYNTPIYIFHNDSYNTQCQEFQSFVKSINDNPSNKILITYKSKDVSGLVTRVDTKLDMVEYVLT